MSALAATAPQFWDMTVDGSYHLKVGVPTYNRTYTRYGWDYSHFGEYVSTEDVTNSAFEQWFQVTFRQPDGKLTHKLICTSTSLGY